MFNIWPEKDPTPLVDVMTQDEMMEQLLEVYVHFCERVHEVY